MGLSLGGPCSELSALASTLGEGPPGMAQLGSPSTCDPVGSLLGQMGSWMKHTGPGSTPTAMGGDSRPSTCRGRACSTTLP